MSLVFPRQLLLPVKHPVPTLTLQASSFVVPGWVFISRFYLLICLRCMCVCERERDCPYMHMQRPEVDVHVLFTVFMRSSRTQPMHWGQGTSGGGRYSPSTTWLPGMSDWASSTYTCSVILLAPLSSFRGRAGSLTACGAHYFSRIGGSMSSRAPPFPAPPTDEVMNMCSYSLLLYGFWGLGSSIFPGKQEKFIHWASSPAPFVSRGLYKSLLHKTVELPSPPLQRREDLSSWAWLCTWPTLDLCGHVGMHRRLWASRTNLSIAWDSLPDKYFVCRPQDTAW